MACLDEEEESVTIIGGGESVISTSIIPKSCASPSPPFLACLRANGVDDVGRGICDRERGLRVTGADADAGVGD